MIKNIGFIGILFLVFGLCLTVSAQEVKHSSRILFVPLDDRPPTFQWVVKMGKIGDAEVVAPPRELLGRFTEFGKPDAIIEWLNLQDLKKFDAAVVSVDMLAYGGLVAMREYETDLPTARKRLEFIREMKRRAPQLKIYASSVIMRLAPTGNVVNESYRENLAKWAEISVDENLKKETAELEKKIPAEALKKYKLARERDLQINLVSVKLVQDKILEQLILGQDDAKPKGVHVADRERLIAEIKKLKLESKIGVQPGADELSMLQLARSLGDKYKFRPRIKAIYSSEATKNQFMPYEDRPLHQTVSFQIASVGAVEVANAQDADILFYVYASRFETGRAESFANEIKSGYMTEKNGFGSLIPNAKPFIIADVDPKGDVQGADPKFTEALLVKLILRRAEGYAAWNTAGNTVGTALPHGFIFNLAKKAFSFPRLTPIKVSQNEWRRRNKIMERVDLAQTWFMLNRLLDDYVYHSLVRPEAIKTARANGWNTLRLTVEQTAQTAESAGRRVKAQAARILNYISPFDQTYSSDAVCAEITEYDFDLPWNRTFEAELDYEMDCQNK